jgi:succinyl-CoA synthetase alpha subunit
MAILVSKHTRVFVQGFTGRQGRSGKRIRHLTCRLDGVSQQLAGDGRAPVVVPGMVNAIIFISLIN